MKTAINKKSKYKSLQLKAIATDYLTNISLDGNHDPELNNFYFDKLISNEFDCFLNFNKISLEKSKQTEYFKYYKNRLTNENYRYKTARLDNFLQTEFNAESTKIYIDDILSKKKKVQPQSANVPMVQIIPSRTFDNATNLVSDVETDYIQKQIQYLSSINSENYDKQIENLEAINNLKQCLSSNATISSTSSLSNSYKLSQSLSVALQSISTVKRRLSTRVSRSPNLEEPGCEFPIETDLESNIGCKKLVSKNSKQTLNPKQNRIQRTTSESSNESNYNTLSSSNTNNRNFKALMHYKPGLFNNLKKLNNEKLFLVSNSTPVGIFSRLPFRLTTCKYDLNESLHKTRHSSIVKASQLTNQKSNHFVNDVFELLDLDFEEYIRQGEMSYVNLIDPVAHTKQRYYRRTITSNDDSDQGCIIEKQEDLDVREKEDVLLSESLKQNYKKETNPFMITAYQSDYLDDPQLTELTAGKNRTCLKFPSYAVSIIDYVKPLDLKKEINETFKEKFPFFQISLTKLRSIKREMLEIGAECSLDAIIVAQSYIYFEQLILRGLINKMNRKLLAANCLLIAAKLNDVTKKEINKLIDSILNKFRFDSKKEIISHEFPILVALEFNLMIRYEADFISHYERVLSNSDYLKLHENHKYHYMKALNE